MKKVLSILLLIVIMMTGCSQNRDPKTAQLTSASQINSDLNAYNQYAQENDKPIVDLVKLTISKPIVRNIVKNQETIKTEDVKIYFYSKLYDLEIGDVCEVKVYKPDGKLFAQINNKYSFKSGKWTIHKTFLVEDYLTSKFKGKWKYELYIKNKKVTSNNFILGNYKKIEKEESKSTIG